MIRIAIAGIVLGAVVLPADAQQRRGQSTPAAERKLYCWEENGRKVCGDALPASAVDSARTEISPRSGLQVGQVGRALTAEERAAAEAEAARARSSSSFSYDTAIASVASWRWRCRTRTRTSCAPRSANASCWWTRR
jgi:hypothetical protein